MCWVILLVKLLDHPCVKFLQDSRSILGSVECHIWMGCSFSFSSKWNMGVAFSAVLNKKVCVQETVVPSVSRGTKPPHNFSRKGILSLIRQNDTTSLPPRKIVIFTFALALMGHICLISKIGSTWCKTNWIEIEFLFRKDSVEMIQWLICEISNLQPLSVQR